MPKEFQWIPPGFCRAEPHVLQESSPSDFKLHMLG